MVLEINHKCVRSNPIIIFPCSANQNLQNLLTAEQIANGLQVIQAICELKNTNFRYLYWKFSSATVQVTYNFQNSWFLFFLKKSELMFFRGKNLLSSPAMNQRSLMPSKNMHAWRFLRKHCTQESCTKTIGITVTNQWMHECSLFLTHLTAWAKLLTFGALPSNSTELKQTPEVKHCTLNAIYL